jgi:hypothetical protein
MTFMCLCLFKKNSKSTRKEKVFLSKPFVHFLVFDDKPIMCYIIWFVLAFNLKLEFRGYHKLYRSIRKLEDLKVHHSCSFIYLHQRKIVWKKNHFVQKSTCKVLFIMARNLGGVKKIVMKFMLWICLRLNIWIMGWKVELKHN